MKSIVKMMRLTFKSFQLYDYEEYKPIQLLPKLTERFHNNAICKLVSKINPKIEDDRFGDIVIS